MPRPRLRNTNQQSGARKTLVFLTLLIAGLLLSSCTRAEVTAAVSTIVVDLEATLEPLDTTQLAPTTRPQPPLEETSETITDASTKESVGGASELISTIEQVVAEFLATDTPTPRPTNTMVPTSPPEIEETAAPLATKPPAATPAPSLTPLPSATALPTNTPIPTETQLPTNTPSPTETPLPTNTPPPSVTPSPTAIPDTLVSSGTEMVLVAGGEFTMGGDSEALLDECERFRSGCQASWFTASEPAHEIHLSDFYIDRTEVTNLAFTTFLNDVGPDHACGGDNCLDPDETQIVVDADGMGQIAADLASAPVAGITWDGAAAYCEWHDARLPTEAEWEKAALWNPDSQTQHHYPWGDSFDDSAVNICDSQCDAEHADMNVDDGFAAAAPVGSFESGRSATGAFDMAGNLWEWVSDWFAEGYYAGSPDENPTGPEKGDFKVVRGGSWFDSGNFVSGLIRFPSGPDNADKTIGFRCVQSVTP